MFGCIKVFILINTEFIIGVLHRLKMHGPCYAFCDSRYVGVVLGYVNFLTTQKKWNVGLRVLQVWTENTILTFYFY